MLFNWVQPLFNRYAQRCAKGVTRVSFAWTYMLASGTLCYCMLHECIVGTLDARGATGTP